MSLKQLKDVTYFKLNNEINIPVNGSIPLAKDKEAITAFKKQLLCSRVEGLCLY